MTNNGTRFTSTTQTVWGNYNQELFTPTKPRKIGRDHKNESMLEWEQVFKKKKKEKDKASKISFQKALFISY